MAGDDGSAQHEAELTVEVAGRSLRLYDRGGDGIPLLWHHGTPNLGAPPEPLFALADDLGLRFIGYDRPGYGGSDPHPGRLIASAADDALAVAEALGLDRFGVIGHSGGASHALAVAALLGDRVLGAIGISGLAPFDADGLDWFEGMAPGSAGSLRAAAAGREEKERWEAQEPGAAPGSDDIGFTAADEAALESDWAWVMEVVRPALGAGPAALIDDDLAHTRPWGFDPATIAVPTLLLHGADDRMVPPAHSRWLADRIPGADLRIVPGAGHVSVLRHSPAALEWLVRVTD